MEFLMVTWQQICNLSSGVSLGIVFLAVFGGHWFWWHVIPGATDENGELKSVLRYVYGCSCIFLGPFLFACFNPLASAPTAVVFMGLSIIAGGAGAVLPRCVKAIAEWQRLQTENAKLQKIADSNGKTDLG